MTLIGYLRSFIAYHTHDDASIDIIIPLIWQQVLIAYSLMSATIPCLKGFLGRFATGDLAKLSAGDIQGTRSSGTRCHGENHVLSTMSSQGNAGKVAKARSSKLALLRPDKIQHNSRVYTDRNPGVSGESVRSFSSQQMIIRRQIDFDVQSITTDEI